MKSKYDCCCAAIAPSLRDAELPPERLPLGRDRSCRIKVVRCFLLLASALVLDLPASAQFNRTQLRSFCLEAEMGLQPFAGIIQGTDGALYGTTLGGAGSTLAEGIQGTIYRINPDGTGYLVLHAFNGLTLDGRSPYAGLTEGRDQLLYGTTLSGGNSNLGTVFRLDKNGSGYTIVHHFTSGDADGANPYSALVKSSDGALTGTTSSGGTSNLGTVFRLNPDGSDFRILHHFTGRGGDGAQSIAALIRSAEGTLYGTTSFGGPSNFGTVFKLNEDGTGYGVIHSFIASGGSGVQPYAALLEGADNRLYGTTAFGGASNLGTVFGMDKDGNNFTVTHSFSGIRGTGTQPYAGLIQGIDGALYGTTAFGGASNQGTLFRLNTNGTPPTVLHNFTAVPSDGATPYAGLIRGNDGLLYGTTYIGGSNNLGTVFKTDPAGTGFGVVRGFVGEAGDAANPYANVIEGSDSVFYGTSWYGGGTNAGSVYRINRDGSGYSVLRSFSGAGGDGANPYARVTEASDHLLYGTTTSGGKSNVGTIYRMNRDGTGYTNLHSFMATAGSGVQPYGPLLEGSDNRLYGTTSAGGAFGRGGIFRMNRDGSLYIVLYTFTGAATSGGQPFAGFIQGGDGALYTTTAFGGTSNLGTVFRIAASGAAPSVLRSFTGSGGDGAIPYAGLCRASDGFLYGTTYSGGTSNLGTVFKLNTNGSGYTVIHRFTGAAGEGANPSADGALVEGPDGSLYGTTYAGGISNLGTIFKLNRDGTGFAVLLSFVGTEGDGARPYAGLARAKDGALYGTTLYGGSGCGTLFRIEPAATFSIATDRSTTLSGPAGYRFLVQQLDQLSGTGAWQNLTNITLLDTPSPVIDPSTGSTDQRFYRALLTP